MIDLRSDTVTVPSRGMREAMTAAEVGDDVFGEDPTVNRLQEAVAHLLGKEAGLYVPSGTMSNQVAIKTHTQPGDELICDTEAHIVHYEAGGPAFHSQVQFSLLPGRHGVFTAEQVAAAIREDNVHMPRSRLVSIENTHNRAGGTIFPLDEIHRIRQVADAHDLCMHLDGARLMNAVVATGIPAPDWTAPFDSVSLCLSKGLGAPVGSVLCGNLDFIRQAHRFRKLFGGGMRQAGIIAAGGLYALQHHCVDLEKDHRHARKLARALEALSAVLIDPAIVQTNIIIFEVDADWGTAADVVQRLSEHDLACLPMGPQKIRLVTHRDLSDNDINQAINILHKVLA